MRQKDRRNRVIFSILSLVIVLTMGLSTVATLTPRRVITPTAVPTMTQFPTRTATPSSG